MVNSRHFSLPLYFAFDYKEYLKFGDITSLWESGNMTKSPGIMRFECTGKVTSNGRYEITFVQMQGTSRIHIGDISFYKRDELMTKTSHDSWLNGEGGTITIPFEITNFEAGTPLFTEREVYKEGGQQTSGAVFIKNTVRKTAVNDRKLTIFRHVHHKDLIFNTFYFLHRQVKTLIF